MEAKARRGKAPCPGLAPEDVIVEEDGEEVEVRHVEAARLKTVHAIVVDVSLSMRQHMEWARRAVLSYVDGLPADEAVLLLAFSDEPVLLSPLTTDRNALRRAADELVVASETALWDALLAAMDLLEPRGERKIIVLISDGADTTSLPGRTMELVAERARQLRDLTIYPVTYRLRSAARSARAGARPRFLLSTLAEESGGKLLDVRDADQLPGAFRDIRDRLDREWWLAYEAPAFGEGARDDPEQLFRDRRVAVRAARGVPCRVRSAGPRTRRAGKSRPTPRVRRTERGSEGNFELEAGARPGWKGAGTARVFMEREGQSGLGLSLPAIQRAMGLLYGAPARPGRRARHLAASEPLFAEGEYRVLTPPLPQVRERLRSPLDVFLALHGEGVLEGTHAPLGPVVLEGRTFLEYREILARGLFEGVPGYRSWAVESLARDRALLVSQLRAALEGSVGEAGPDEADLEAGRMAARHPADSWLSTRLGAWLGDVRAEDLAAALDLRACTARRDALRRDAPPPPPPLEAWRSLRDWLSPPTSVRVVVPLLPAWDEKDGRVGFFRFVLPTPNRDSAPTDTPPPLPLGLELLTQLAQLVPEPSSGLVAERIAYDEDPSSRRAGLCLPRSLGGADCEGSRFRVRIELAGRGDAAVAAWFALEPGDAGLPIAKIDCVDVEGLEALRVALAAKKRLCRASRLR